MGDRNEKGSEKSITKLTLYGDSISGNCLKCKWTAEYVGIPYEWVETSVLKQETRTPEFLATINPVGQVPVAHWPGGRSLAQSNAIVLYLARDSALIPSDPFEQAQMHSWMFWEQYSHEPAIAVRRFHQHFLKTPNHDKDGELLAKGHKALSLLELQLQHSVWLVGDAISCADVALVAYTRVAHEGGYDLSEYPAVQAWVGRVEKQLGITPAAKS